MYQILNGKRYNTESARKVGTWDNGHYSNDFSYCYEALYQKRTGEYFIAGEGGPMSKYATHHGDNTGWGEEINPLTVDEAKEWAEEHLDAENAEQEFNIPDEPLPVVAIHLKNMREKKSMTQAVLAEKIGINQQKIAEYENGQDMTIRRFLELCAGLGVTPVEFWQ